MHGFYVVNGVGNITHNNHPKCGCNMIASSTRQLDEVNLTLIKDMYDSQSSYSIISNVIQGRTGITFSNAKILYHCGLLNHF